MTERKVENIADDKALGNILRGKRPFSIQVVPVLYLTHATSWSFQPARQRIGVAHEFGVRVSHQQSAAALESAGDSSLQRVVIAAAAAVTIQVQPVVLRVGTFQLTGRNR